MNTTNRTTSPRREHDANRYLGAERRTRIQPVGLGDYLRYNAGTERRAKR
jgi:hypothetical protein